MGHDQNLKYISAATNKPEQNEMCKACNDCIFIMTKGTYIQRPKHALHTTAKVITDPRNILIIHNHMGDWMTINVYESASNEAWNRKTQSLQSSNERSIITFLIA